MKRCLIFLLFSLFTLFSFNCGEPKFKEFSSEAGKFSILMPGNPLFEESEEGLGAEKVKVATFTAEVKPTGYIVAYREYSEEKISSANQQELLTFLRNGLLNSTSGTLISNKEISLGESKGLEFSAKGKNKEKDIIIAGRLFVIKSRIFQILAVTEGNVIPQHITNFLESFKTLK